MLPDSCPQAPARGSALSALAKLFGMLDIGQPKNLCRPRLPLILRNVSFGKTFS